MKVFKFRIIIGYEDEQEIFYLGEEMTSRFVLQENFLEGHISLDYMIGYINQDILHIIIYDETGENFQFQACMNGETIQNQTIIFLKSMIEEDAYCCMFCEEIEEYLLQETYGDIAEAKEYCIFNEI